MGTIELNGVVHSNVGKVWYVSTQGNDSNPGTENEPLATVQSAVTKASSGDLIYAKEGTYRPNSISTWGAGLYDQNKQLIFAGDPGRTIFLMDGNEHSARDQHALSTRNPGTKIYHIIFDVIFRDNQNNSNETSLFNTSHIDSKWSEQTKGFVYNCVFKTNKRAAMNYDGSGGGKLYLENCLFDVPDNFIGSYNYPNNYELSNCVTNKSWYKEGLAKKACLENCNFDQDYRIISAPGSWIDTGIYEDKDGSPADLGVYGGRYAWDFDFDVNSIMWVGPAIDEIPGQADIAIPSDIHGSIRVTNHDDIEAKVAILHRDNIISSVQVWEKNLLPSLINIPPPYDNNNNNGWLKSSLGVRLTNELLGISVDRHGSPFQRQAIPASINVFTRGNESLVSSIGVRISNELNSRVLELRGVWDEDISGSIEISSLNYNDLFTRLGVRIPSVLYGQSYIPQNADESLPSSITVTHSDWDHITGKVIVRPEAILGGHVITNNGREDIPSKISIVRGHSILWSNMTVKYRTELNLVTDIIGVGDSDLKSIIDPRYRGNDDAQVSIRVNSPYVHDNEYGKVFKSSIRIIAAGNSDIQSSLSIPILNKMTGISDIIGVNESNIQGSIRINQYDSLPSSIRISPRNKMTSIIEIRPPERINGTVSVNKDSYVRQSLDKFNFGQDPTLTMGYSANKAEKFRTLVGFDISDITNLREGYSIDEVHLKLRFTIGRNPKSSLSLYEAIGDWTELGVTWSNQPRIGGLVSKKYVTDSTEGYITFDITDYIRNAKEQGITYLSFYLNATDELENNTTSFFSKESGNGPTIEYKYYDEVLRNSSKADLDSNVFIYSIGHKDQRSKINVKGIVWSEIPSSILVQRPGDFLSSITVTRSDMSGSMDVIARDDSDIKSSLTVQESLYFDIGGSIIPSKKSMPSEIYVAERYDVSSSLSVRVLDVSEIISWMTVSNPSRPGSIYVIPYVDLEGSISVRREAYDDLESGYFGVSVPQISLSFYVLPHEDLNSSISIRGEEKHELNSSISVNRPDNPSSIYVVPYYDRRGVIRVRRSTRADQISTLAISRPQFSGSLEVMSGDNLKGSIVVNRYDEEILNSQLVISHPDLRGSIHPKIAYDTSGTITVNKLDKDDLISTSYVLHRSDIKGSLEVWGASMIPSSIRVLSGYLRGTIGVPANDETEIEGSITVRQTDESWIKSQIDVWQFRLLPSKIVTRRSEESDIKSSIEVRQLESASIPSKVDIWKYDALKSKIDVRRDAKEFLDSSVYVLFSSDIKSFINVRGYSDVNSSLRVVYGSTSDIDSNLTPRLIGYDDIDTSVFVMYRVNRDLRSKLRVGASNKMTAILDITDAPREYTTIYAVKDSFVRSGMPTLNYGLDKSIPVGKSNNEILRSLIGFDISQIPSGDTIDKVELVINYSTLRDKDIRAYAIGNDWTELGVTWNNHPNSDQYVNSNNPKCTVDTLREVIKFDVTEYVRDGHYDVGDQFVNFLLKAFNESQDGYLNLMSRESGRIPRLEVVHYNPEVWSYNRAHLDAKIDVKYGGLSQIPSTVTVNTYDGYKDTYGKINVLSPSDFESNLSTRIAVSRPDIDGSVNIIGRGDSDIESSITVMISTVEELPSSLVVSQINLGSTIVVPDRSEIGGSITPRILDNSDLLTWITVNAKDRPSSIYVPYHEDLSSSIVVNGYKDYVIDSEIAISRPELEGSILVKIASDNDMDSSISVRNTKDEDLDSTLIVTYGDFKVLLSKINVKVTYHPGENTLPGTIWVGDAGSDLGSIIALSKPSLPSVIGVPYNEDADIESSIAVSRSTIPGSILISNRDDMSGQLEVFYTDSISSELTVTVPSLSGSISVPYSYDMKSKLDIVKVEKEYLNSTLIILERSDLDSSVDVYKHSSIDSIIRVISDGIEGTLIIPRRSDLPSTVDVYKYMDVDGIIRVISGNLGSKISVRRDADHDMDSRLYVVNVNGDSLPSSMFIVTEKDYIKSRIAVRFESPLYGEVDLIGVGESDLVSILRPVVFSDLPAQLSITITNKMTGEADFIPVGDSDVPGTIDLQPAANLPGSITVLMKDESDIEGTITVRAKDNRDLISKLDIRYRGTSDLDSHIRIPYTNKMTGLVDEISLLTTDEGFGDDVVIELKTYRTVIDESSVEEKSYIAGRIYYDDAEFLEDIQVGSSTEDSSSAISHSVIHIDRTDSGNASDSLVTKEFVSFDAETSVESISEITVPVCDSYKSTSSIVELGILGCDSSEGVDFVLFRGIVYYDSAAGEDCYEILINREDSVSHNECSNVVLELCDSSVPNELFLWDILLADQSTGEDCIDLQFEICDNAYSVHTIVDGIQLADHCDEGKGTDSVPVREFVSPDSGVTEHRVVGIYIELCQEVVVTENPVIYLSTCDDGEGSDWTPVREFISPDLGYGQDSLVELMLEVEYEILVNDHVADIDLLIHCDSGNGIDRVAVREFITQDSGYSEDQVSNVNIVVCDDYEVEYLTQIDLSYCDEAVAQELLTKEVMVKDEGSSDEQVVLIHLKDILDDDSSGNDCYQTVEVVVCEINSVTENVLDIELLVSDIGIGLEGHNVLFNIDEGSTAVEQVVDIDVVTCDQGSGIDLIIERGVLVSDSSESEENVVTIHLTNPSDEGSGVDCYLVEVLVSDLGQGNDIIGERGVLSSDPVFGIETSIVAIPTCDTTNGFESGTYIENPVCDGSSGLDVIVERGVVVRELLDSDELEFIEIPVSDTFSEDSRVIHIELPVVDEGNGEDISTEKEVLVSDSSEAQDTVNSVHVINLCDSGQSKDSLSNVNVVACDNAKGSDRLDEKMVVATDSAIAIETSIILIVTEGDASAGTDSAFMTPVLCDEGKGHDSTKEKMVISVDEGYGNSECWISLDLTDTAQYFDTKELMLPAEDEGNGYDNVTSREFVLEDNSDVVDIIVDILLNVEENYTSEDILTVGINGCDDGAGYDFITHRETVLIDNGDSDSHVVDIHLIDIEDNATVIEIPVIRPLVCDSGTIDIEIAKIDKYLFLSDSGTDCESVFIKGTENTEVRDLSYPGQRNHPSDVSLGPIIDGISPTKPNETKTTVWTSKPRVSYILSKYDKALGLWQGDVNINVRLQETSQGIGGYGRFKVFIDDELVVSASIPTGGSQDLNFYYDGLKSKSGGYRLEYEGTFCDERHCQWSRDVFFEFTYTGEFPRGIGDNGADFVLNPDYPANPFIDPYGTSILSNSINCDDDPSRIKLYVSTCGKNLDKYEWSMFDDPDYRDIEVLYHNLAIEARSNKLDRWYVIASDCAVSDNNIIMIELNQSDEGTSVEIPIMDKTLLVGDSADSCEAIFVYGHKNTEDRDLSYPGESTHPTDKVLNPEIINGESATIVGISDYNDWTAGTNQTVRPSRYIGLFKGTITFELRAGVSSDGSNFASSSGRATIYVDGVAYRMAEASASNRGGTPTRITIPFDGWNSPSGGFSAKVTAVPASGHRCTATLSVISLNGTFYPENSLIPDGSALNPKYPGDYFIDPYDRDIFPLGKYCGDNSQVYLYVNSCKQSLHDYNWSMLGHPDYERIKGLYQNTVNHKPYPKSINKNFVLAADCGYGEDESSLAFVLTDNGTLDDEKAILNKHIIVRDSADSIETLVIDQGFSDEVTSEDGMTFGLILCDNAVFVDRITDREFVIQEYIKVVECLKVHVSSDDTSSSEEHVASVHLYPSEDSGTAYDRQLSNGPATSDYGYGNDCYNNVEVVVCELSDSISKVVQLDLSLCEITEAIDFLSGKEFNTWDLDGKGTDCLQLEIPGCESPVIEEDLIYIDLGTHYDESEGQDSVVYKELPVDDEATALDELSFSIELCDSDKFLDGIALEMFYCDTALGFDRITDKELPVIDSSSVDESSLLELEFCEEVVSEFNVVLDLVSHCDTAEGRDILPNKEVPVNDNAESDECLVNNVLVSDEFGFEDGSLEDAAEVVIELCDTAEGIDIVPYKEILVSEELQSIETARLDLTLCDIGKVKDVVVQIDLNFTDESTGIDLVPYKEMPIEESAVLSDCITLESLFCDTGTVKDKDESVIIDLSQCDSGIGIDIVPYKELPVSDSIVSDDCLILELVLCEFGHTRDWVPMMEFCVCDWGTDPQDPGPPNFWCCGRYRPGHIPHPPYFPGDPGYPYDPDHPDYGKPVYPDDPNYPGPPYNPGDPGYPADCADGGTVYPGDVCYPGRPLYPGDPGYPSLPGDPDYGEPIYPGDPEYPPILNPGDPGYPYEPSDPGYGDPVYPGDPDYPKAPGDPTDEPESIIGHPPTPDVGVAIDCITIEQFLCDDGEGQDKLGFRRVPYHIDNDWIVDPFTWKCGPNFEWDIEEIEFEIKPIEIQVEVTEYKFNFRELEFKFRETPEKFEFADKLMFKACPLDIFEFQEAKPIVIEMIECPFTIQCTELEED
ncbi:pectate lyase [Bacillus phage SP-15]|uniref:Pectate lyase n=1 Tax=Bacillus phage SP-15 TaxID=1792032 RepID=A0A127AWB0_9CAUD|nr:pectate lyase [Bacillus phage SP-15]AMM44863.1 pectate lyase [Bacillus phage SP-15]